MQWEEVEKNHQTRRTLAPHDFILPSCRKMIQTFNRSQALVLLWGLDRNMVGFTV